MRLCNHDLLEQEVVGSRQSTWLLPALNAPHSNSPTSPAPTTGPKRARLDEAGAHQSMAGSQPTPTSVGARVVVNHLQFTPQYNGETGTIMAYIDSSQRFQIKMAGRHQNQQISVRGENLRITDAALPPAPPPALATLKAVVYRPPPAMTGAGGKYGGKGRGEAAGKAACLRCRACNVESSGEESFLQHIMGKAHQRRAGRWQGLPLNHKP